MCKCISRRRPENRKIDNFNYYIFAFYCIIINVHTYMYLFIYINLCNKLNKLKILGKNVCYYVDIEKSVRNYIDIAISLFSNVLECFLVILMYVSIASWVDYISQWRNINILIQFPGIGHKYLTQLLFS